MQTITRTVSRYDWTLYHQAVAKAKAQFRKDKNKTQFQQVCMTAYNRMMESPETEVITGVTNAQ